jgi:DeoR/GlpR family transcriptional regulator of sugar metabolism
VDLLANERQQKILTMLKTSGAVTTAELIDAFDVSIETVRRDLLQLERSGQLQRVHGGAVIPGNMRPYTDLPHRLEANQDAKAELCATAALLVEEDDIICIDSGSTAYFFAKVLADRFSRLTVITHSMDVFEILSQKEGFRIILAGGCYLPQEKAFHGSITLDTLRQLHVRKAFLCPSAISLKTGIWDYDRELTQVQKQILSICDQAVFLADSVKFETSALLKLCDTAPNHIYVTDSGLPQQYKQFYRDRDRIVITCKDDIKKGN